MLSTGAIAGYSVLGVFGGYVVTSILLLRCPGLLHKKKKRHFLAAHISHRGGAAEKIENTISAFDNAIANGTQLLELDVHLTRDKEIVVSHDGDLTRCTGFEGNIADCKYEDLPLMSNELKVTFYNRSCVTSAHEKIPTLQEVFERFPRTPVNLDVKDNDDELMVMVEKLIREYKREKITVWGNFSDEVTNKLYKLNGEIPLLFSIKRVVSLYASFYLGLLPFLPIRESFLEIPFPDAVKHTSIQLTPGRKRILKILKPIFQSKILFKHLHRRGIPTYMWVVNEEEGFEAAFKLGVEGVMTDCPTKLKRWLDDNPKYWV